MRNLFYLSFIFAVLFSACKSAESGTKANEPITMADEILNKSILAHGGDKYNTANYSFVFRKKQYSFKFNGDIYEYKMTATKDGVTSENMLNNVGFTRKVDGKIVSLDEKKISGYSGSLNSVIYFATLPYKLQDPAVYKKYIGETTIKNQSYHVLEITFNSVGGGRDHEDEFYYWINKENFQIDYMAYNYLVNNGGVRFRSAYNKRNVDGIVFQDYVNYKAEVGTPLGDLPKLFEAAALKKLSLIETEEVLHLKN